MGAPYAAPNNSLHQPIFWPNDKPPSPPVTTAPGQRGTSGIESPVSPHGPRAPACCAANLDLRRALRDFELAFCEKRCENREKTLVDQHVSHWNSNVTNQKLCIANSSSVPFEILMCLAVQIEIQTVGHGVVLGLPIHFYRCPNSGLALDGKGIETHWRHKSTQGSFSSFHCLDAFENALKIELCWGYHSHKL